MHPVLVSLLAIAMAAPAVAQSSLTPSDLGITGALLSFGATDDEGGTARSSAHLQLDVAVTGVHGFQGDLRFFDTPSGGTGVVAAHLYMGPKDSRKYGLFAQLGDVDGRAMTYGALGAEALLSLGAATSVEAQAGIGAASDGLDFLFAGAALHHGVTPDLSLTASLDLVEFDEPGLRALSHETALRLDYSPEGARWGLYASLSHGGLSGRDGVSADTRVGLGVTLRLGQTGGIQPTRRPFRPVDPMAPLLRRGLW
ncbi:MAG: hypothetical protein OIF48_17775 [Silicimonas sp.]|nr:hypothetical protein [Silicimonas sp.]